MKEGTRLLRFYDPLDKGMIQGGGREGLACPSASSVRLLEIIDEDADNWVVIENQFFGLRKRTRLVPKRSQYFLAIEVRKHEVMDPPLELVANRYIPRHRCPFHGFLRITDALMDWPGTCGIAGENSECLHKHFGISPDKNECPLVAKYDRAELVDIYHFCYVYPAEFAPIPVSRQGESLISFETWYDYILATSSQLPGEFSLETLPNPRFVSQSPKP